MNEMTDNELFMFALSDLQQIINNEIKLLIFTDELRKDNSLDDIFNFLLFNFSNCRHHAVKTEEHVEAIWGELRKSDKTTDFVLTVTSKFKSMMGKDALAQLFTLLMNGYARGFDEKPGKNSCIDRDTYQRLPTIDEVSDLLGSNHWLAILYLITFLDIDDILSPLSSKRGKRVEGN
jgi:hypothetical protein